MKNLTRNEARFFVYLREKKSERVEKTKEKKIFIQ